jgi:hypothetical protein
MGHESGDCTETWGGGGGSVVKLRLLRFSTHAIGEDIEAIFGSYEPGPGETTDSGVSTGPARGVLYRARWPIRGGGEGEGLWVSKRAGFVSLEPVSTIYRLPIAPQMHHRNHYFEQTLHSSDCTVRRR